jgi:hypothetical protein
MTIEWLAGNRIIGTTAERPSASLQSPSVGGWKEVGRVSLSGSSSSVDLSSNNKRYYMVLCTGITSSTNGDYQIEYNGDASGGDYNNRTSFNGGGDYQENGVNYLRPLGTTANLPFFDVNYVANKSNKEKLVLGRAVQSNGTGTGTSTLTRSIYVGKYTNTSSAINEIKAKLRVGTFSSGELVVLGYDPDDTHTDNFWEELASVTLTADSRLIDSGTFTAKKFLKFAVYNTAKASGNNYYMFFNNIESGTTHSGRSNANGRNPTSTSAKSDYELAGSNGFIINHDPSSSGSTTQLYSTGYIANTSGEQKLSINETVTGWTNATNASQAPARFQTVDKATTTDQITSIQFGQSSGTTVGAGSVIKVWGHD